MPKRRIRITPKVSKRTKRVVISPNDEKSSQTDASQSSQAQGSSAESTERTTRKKKDMNNAKAPRKKSSSAKDQVEVPAVKKIGKHTNSRKPANKSPTKATKTSTAKNTRKSRTASTYKSAAREAGPSISERIRDLHVARTTYEKWPALSTASKDYIKQVLDGAIPNIISTIADDEDREDAQQHLTKLNKCISRRLNNLKGPKNESPYRNTESQCKSFEEQLTSNNIQLAMLEKELEEQKSLFEEEEEKLDVYTNQIMPPQYDIHQEKLHPFLSIEPVDTLHLPKLPSDSLSKPIPQIPKELQGGAKRLAETLTSLDDQMVQLGPIKEWLETVSILRHNLALNRNDIMPDT